MIKFISFIRRTFLSVLIFGCIQTSFALPFSITPKAGTTLPTSIVAGSTATAYYTVINNTITTRNNNHVTYLPPNVTQVTNAGGDSCGAYFNLASKASCTLQLTVLGPVNANDPNPKHHLFVCFPGNLTCAGTNYPLNVSSSNTPTPPVTARSWTTNGAVYSTLYDSANHLIYLGGSFSYVGPLTGYAVPINTATGAANANYPVANYPLKAITSDGANGWYIASYFTQVGGLPDIRLTHILPDGSVDPNFSIDLDGDVYTLLLNGNTLYLGGDFTTVGGQARNYLAAINITTSTVTSWNPNSNNWINALAISGGTIYVGGDFNRIGNLPYWGIAPISIATGLPTFQLGHPH